MTLIPAPGRQLKTWSMILVIMTGLFDLAMVLMQTFSDMHIISAEHLSIINAVMLFLIGAVRFVHQQISVSTEQKEELIQAAADQPMKHGQADVAVSTVVVEPPTSSNSKAVITALLDQREAAINQQFDNIRQVLEELRQRPQAAPPQPPQPQETK